MTADRDTREGATAPETYAERKERERQRDAIRELAFRVADHVAGSDLATVERVKYGVNFSHPISDHRCECGLQLVPLPVFHKRWGVLPTWYCVVCSLDLVVAVCERIREEVQPSVPAKAKGVAA